MAVAKPGSANADASVNNSDVNNLYSAAIYTVQSDGTINSDENNNAGSFLINPSTLEETKSANWTPHNVPGQSDPILQWTNSGARTLTFTALVTNDTSKFFGDSMSAPKKRSNPLLSAIPIVGVIASLFSDIASGPTSADLNPPGSPLDLDISLQLNFYRSLLYPMYDTSPNVVPNKLLSSPPLVVLYMGNSLTNVPFNDKIDINTEVWVVTNLRIKISKQLPNLAPMEAEVEFQLTQYTVKSIDRNRFLVQTNTNTNPSGFTF